MFNPRTYSILSNAKSTNFMKVSKTIMRVKPQSSEENIRLQPINPPNSWECCGNDCPNCVWNIYFNKLKEYNRLRKSKKMILENDKS